MAAIERYSRLIGSIRNFRIGFVLVQTQQCDFELPLNPYFVPLSFSPSYPHRQLYVGVEMSFDGQSLNNQPFEVPVLVLGTKSQLNYSVYSIIDAIS
jgi:hypothetical protein